MTLNLLSRDWLRFLVSVFKGEMGTHTMRLNLYFNDFYISCDDEDEEEFVKHILCLRLSLLGRQFLHD